MYKVTIELLVVRQVYTFKSYAEASRLFGEVGKKLYSYSEERKENANERITDPS